MAVPRRKAPSLDASEPRVSFASSADIARAGAGGDSRRYKSEMSRNGKRSRHSAKQHWVCPFAALWEERCTGGPICDLGAWIYGEKESVKNEVDSKAVNSSRRDRKKRMMSTIENSRSLRGDLHDSRSRNDDTSEEDLVLNPGGAQRTLSRGAAPSDANSRREMRTLGDPSSGSVRPPADTLRTEMSESKDMSARHAVASSAMAQSARGSLSSPSMRTPHPTLADWQRASAPSVGTRSAAPTEMFDIGSNASATVVHDICTPRSSFSEVSKSLSSAHADSGRQKGVPSIDRSTREKFSDLGRVDSSDNKTSAGRLPLVPENAESLQQEESTKKCAGRSDVLPKASVTSGNMTVGSTAQTHDAIGVSAMAAAIEAGMVQWIGPESAHPPPLAKHHSLETANGGLAEEGENKDGREHTESEYTANSLTKEHNAKWDAAAPEMTGPPQSPQPTSTTHFGVSSPMSDFSVRCSAESPNGGMTDRRPFGWHSPISSFQWKSSLSKCSGSGLGRDLPSAVHVPHADACELEEKLDRRRRIIETAESVTVQTVRSMDSESNGTVDGAKKASPLRSPSKAPFPEPRRVSKHKTATTPIAVAEQLPPGPRVCILGGTKFTDPASESLVKSLGGAFAERLAGHVVVLTGGMPGVQQTFATSLGDTFPALVHLLPEGTASNFGVGVDIAAGETLSERMAIFGQLGDIYIVVEGGPGAASEADAAFTRGALVLPMMSTGGASSGMFNFPADALQRPACATEEQWSCLHDKSAPEVAAAAVVEMIKRHVDNKQVEQEAVTQQLPRGPRVCILGGTAFKDPASETLVKALGGAFAERLAGHVVVLTGGMPGVQQTFASSLGNTFPALVHLLPEGTTSNFGLGVDIAAGTTLSERMAIFGQVGDIYVVVEGGPGVAIEATAAFTRGALLLPMMSTGGASSGMFDFPADALQRPACATEEQWSCLREKSAPEVAAATVVEMIQRHVEKMQVEQEAEVTEVLLDAVTSVFAPPPPAEGASVADSEAADLEIAVDMAQAPSPPAEACVDLGAESLAIVAASAQVARAGNLSDGGSSAAPTPASEVPALRLAVSTAVAAASDSAFESTRGGAGLGLLGEMLAARLASPNGMINGSYPGSSRGGGSGTRTPVPFAAFSSLGSAPNSPAPLHGGPQRW